MKYIKELKPHLVEKPWGGHFISSLLKLSDGHDRIGEAFLVSTLINNQTKVRDRDLSDYLNTDLPYLIKVIDASDNLSIQVHPDNSWAAKLEGSIGKTECWYVLDALDSSGIYYGFKNGYTFADILSACEKGDDVSRILNFQEVKSGDFIIVPAGTIHAIGAGVKILEFQQSSGITYRIWDWNRPGRELHLEKSAKVTNPKVGLAHVKNFKDFIPGEKLLVHDDFELIKLNQNEIFCRSNKVNVSATVNVETLQTTLMIPQEKLD